MEWYFPETLEDAVGLLQKPAVAPHGGGTGIIRGRLDRYRGLISLDKLGLNYIRQEGDMVEIGATATYSDIIDGLPNCILARSLSLAASTPLRNRITLGGSVAYFPIWSDLMGPLMALNATVQLVGENEGEFPIAEFARNRTLKRHSLVKSVTFRRFTGYTYYHRVARTHFDYGSLNISLLFRAEDGVVSEFRLVLVGSKEKFRIFDELAEHVVGKEVGAIKPRELVKSIEDGVQFHDTRIGSGEYTRAVALVEMERAIASAVMNAGGEK